MQKHVNRRGVSHKKRAIVAADCETDPFKHGRVPEPFLWGLYDGHSFLQFDRTEDFVAHIRDLHAFIFAHNGGKFDWIYLVPYFDECRVKLIKGRIVEVKIGKAILRDSWSIIPIALRDYRKDEIEYWKLEADCRARHMPEIVSYLKTDCVALHELVTRYFDRVGKQITIASNALASARKLKIDVGKTTHKFDQFFRPWYFGGRCEVFKSGRFNGISSYDIVSAYPFAMWHEHATGDEYSIGGIDDLSEKELQRSFIDLTCNAAGCFPVIEKHGLTFPHGKLRFKVTGWEYVAALKHRLINDVEIHAVYSFKKKIHFREYVTQWFLLKEAGKKSGDKADYIIGKIMMNSLYGKLAQNPVEYRDYRILPAGSPIEFNDGWQYDEAFGDKELHSRPAMWRVRAKYGEEWDKFPIHFNVATAASITGFTRAYLLDCAHTVGIDHVYYCDTDCLFVDKNAQMKSLRMDGKLGSWEYEGTAEKAIIAGKKLYAMRYTSGPVFDKNGGPLEKLRCKGAALRWQDFETIIDGGIVSYRRDAPSFSMTNNPNIAKKEGDNSGFFIVRSIRATAKAGTARHKSKG